MTHKTSINSYGKVWRFSDFVVRSQFSGMVEVEEKIDGSQFSASIPELDQPMIFRSNNVQVDKDNPGMFLLAVENASKMDLIPGNVYRFEYLQKPKHNTLVYDRTPKNHLILFEVESSEYRIYGHDEMASEAERIGIESVPLLYRGPVSNINDVTVIDLMSAPSILGTKNIEGIVIKQRDNRHDRDGKVLKAKIVSEAFTERNNKEWKSNRKVSSKDIIVTISDSLATEPRYEKCLQHLKEEGNCKNEFSDIGGLIAAMKKDILDEDVEYIKDALYRWAIETITRQSVRGIPKWYKDKINQEAMELNA